MSVFEQAFFPISELSTYHSKWTIRARVTQKGSIKTFTPRNGGAQGQVFDLHLLDESNVEIRANLFGAAAEHFIDKIQQGKVYTFSKGNIRVANRQYNRCNHRYELIFDAGAEITEVADDAKIKSMSFEVIDLTTVQARPLPCTVDLCGVVVSFRSVMTFTSSSGASQGKELVKREITIADHTSTSMNVTLWGERAKQDDKVFEGKPVVALKGVNVKEWQGGRAGSLSESGVLEFSPDLPEVKKLQQWWAANSACVNLNSLSLAQDALTDLQALQSMPVPCTVELCGIIVAFKPFAEFTSQAGKVLQKREITIADYTGNSLGVTIWGDRAQQDDAKFDNNPVVSLKGVRIGEWNGGRQGSLMAAGMMTFQPSTPEAARIQSWWSQGGSSQKLTALSIEGGGSGGKAGKPATLAEMRQAADLIGVEPEFFIVVSRLALVQTQKQGQPQPLYYMACQETRRKVDETGFCASCNRIVQTAPRLNIRCKFSDVTDSAWLTTFHEAAVKVLDKTAEEVKTIETGEGGREAVEATIRRCYFSQPLQLGIRVKQDTYNGETRANISCIDARPVQRGAHGRTMLKEISEMLAKPAVADSAVSAGA